MKLKNILMTAAIALTGVVSANAAISYTAGDLILGFNQTGALYNYEVNLGSITNFLTGTKTITLNTTDLSNGTKGFGSGWANDTTLSWGIAGGGSAVSFTLGGTTYAAGTCFVTSSVQLALKNTGDQQTVSTGINTLATASTANGGFRNMTSATSGATSANAVFVGTGLSGSWFKTAAPANGTSFTKISSPGVNMALTSGSTSTLDLYMMNGSLGASYTDNPLIGTDATKLGTFTLNDSGTLTYEAVPEPSTYAMMGLGGLGLLGMIRRRRA